ncbi:MAG: DUF5666 domain-containing protein [bacterium]|nr:DUF5666 domain-containing protein [bacterium]
MRLKHIAYSGVVALSLASLALFAAQADERGDKQFREAQAVGSTLEIHVTDSGRVLVRGAKVTSISGSTINATATWGSAVFNWGVVTDSSTEWVRRSGGNSSISEVSVGDFISFQGALDTTVASPITVKAKVVKDWSIQKRHGAFSGSVKNVDGTAKTFVLASEERGDVVVKVLDSTKIKKGKDAGVFTDITVGIKLTAAGLYNDQTKILEADEIKIHAPAAIRTTLEGKIKTAPGSAKPTTMIVTAGDKDYTVSISVDTSVLGNLWLVANLSSFKVGDKVRVYGTVNTDLAVDATVIRNTSI